MSQTYFSSVIDSTQTESTRKQQKITLTKILKESQTKLKERKH